MKYFEFLHDKEIAISTFTANLNHARRLSVKARNYLTHSFDNIIIYTMTNLFTEEQLFRIKWECIKFNSVKHFFFG